MMRWLTICVLLAATACGSETGLPAHDGPGVRYPVTMAADPSGRWVYVVGANFDRAHRSGSVAVLDTVQGAFVSGARAEVPTYALNCKLEVDAAGTGRHRLWVPARDDDSITVLDVDTTGETPTLSCGATTTDDGACASPWRLGGPLVSDLNIGTDPVSLAIEPLQGEERLVHVASAVNAEIASLSVKPREGGGVEAKVLSRFRPTGALSASALVMAPTTGRLYSADVRRNALFPFKLHQQPEQSWSVEQFDGITLPISSGAEYSRAVTMSSDGGRLYVAYRNPNSVLVIDTSLSRAGVPVDRLVDTIGVGGQPAQLLTAPTREDGGELLYVSCFDTDDIWVVDPESRAVVDVIRLPHAPYGMTAVKVPGRGWTLYAGMFTQHRLAVIDLDPSDANRHDVSEFIQ